MSRFRIQNSTTTAALCLALAMPAPLAAQQAAPCGEGTETPCPEGQTPDQAQQAADEARRQAEEAAQAAEAEAQAAAEAEAQRAAEAEAQRLAEEEAAAEAAAAAAAEGEAQAAAEAEAKRQAEEDAAAAAEAETPTETPTETASETPAETPTETTSETSAPEVAQTDSAATTDVANETPEVAAAVTEGEGAAESAAETVTETVVAEEARSSDQEFESRIEAAPAATAAAPQPDGGLSNFEKFALAGVGLVALSAILRKNDRVAAASQDRVIVERDGGYYVIKDDDTLLRRPGSEIVTDRFADGSTRTTVYREDGSRVETIRAASGQVLRRVRYLPDGRAVLLFDDTVAAPPVQLDRLPQTRPIPAGSDPELAAALAAAELADLDRRFSLQQVRQIRAVRELVPPIDLPDVTFETGSAAIRATEAVKLRELGLYMADQIARNPYEVFLIEGHTDAVGSAAFNLALSDRRAESLALALTEYFDVPPESMVVQGYGEANLKISTQAAERANRRVAVRQITPLLRTADLR